MVSGTVVIPLLATLLQNRDRRLPERYLGIDIRDDERLDRVVAQIAQALAQQLDLAQLFASQPMPARVPLEAHRAEGAVRIAFASDDALWFTYPQSRDALQAAGAQLVPFSPLRDATLPAGIHGLWLGGGYSAAHAQALSENRSLLRELHAAIGDGMPSYAQCGGYMYLGEYLETKIGGFPMVGALRGGSSIAEPRLQMGYRSVTVAQDSPLDRRGDAIRAYEFHYASSAFSNSPAYAGNADTGARVGNVVASFLHRRFFVGDQPSCRFVAACAARSV